MDAWSRGRVALIGDATHCPSSLSGMGSGLALVGAYVLAGELAAAHGDHRVALRDYCEPARR
ncbi:FAD-dependent monooxygenase [Streptomyces sp. NPDC048424]|uniref:FAD-dependent monooxygenase n=1 Tax=Streptomyces sp. NPDC048424 TaxID=3155265 RepID=UPI003439B8BF